MSIFRRISKEKEYKYVTGFVNGQAKALLKCEEETFCCMHRVVIIDKKYNQIQKTNYGVISSYGEIWHNGYCEAINYAATTVNNEVFLNKNLEVASELTFISVNWLNNGFARIQVSKDKYGLIDENLETLIPQKYLEVFSISAGMYAGRYKAQDGNMKSDIYLVGQGIIKQMEGTFISKIFSNDREYNVYFEKGKYAICDKQLNLASETKFENISEPRVDNIMFFSEQGKKGYINLVTLEKNTYRKVKASRCLACFILFKL